ncbi:MAG: hypothetical protein LBF91_03410 [Azoarcus sp.]|jgi:hemolysin activation/secretion protein|nr:hypothetical protein [Azoarcus sp.]
MKNILLPFFLAPLLFPLAAHAQTHIPDAGQILRETRPAPPPDERRPPEPDIEQSEDLPLSLPDDQSLRVDAFRFEGAECIAEDVLQAAIADYRGRALSMADIEAAAERITALYRERGYLVARAWVPRQDASGGTLTIRIIVGKYGKRTLRNTSRVRDSQIEGHFAALEDGAAVRRDELERAMLLVSDLPGAAMPKVRLAPGEAAGSADVDIEIAADEPYSAYAIADNHGSRYTGKTRLSLGASWHSPLRLGDTLEFAGTGTEAGRLLSGRLAYAAPLGSGGLRGELAVSRAVYELGDIYAALDAEGVADSLELALSYPLRRTRSHNLTARLDMAGRRMRDEIGLFEQKTTRRLYAATFGLNYDSHSQIAGRAAYFSASGSLTAGRLDIEEAEMKAANRAGADTVGAYGRVNLTLGGQVALGERLSLSATLSAQQSIGRNLDTSEQLLVSGTQGVVAWREIASGDKGWLASLELRHTLPAPAGVRHSVSVFADAARVRPHDGSYTTEDEVAVAGAGIGYRIAWRNLFAHARWAHALGARPDALAGDDRSRFMLQAGVTF